MKSGSTEPTPDIRDIGDPVEVAEDTDAVYYDDIRVYALIDAQIVAFASADNVFAEVLWRVRKGRPVAQSG